MAHDIEGNYAFFGSSQPAWHGLGTVLKDAPTIQEAWKLAYPFELFKLDLEAVTTTPDGQKVTMPIEKSKAILRSDGKHIGTVGEGYELVQPYQAFKFFEPFIASGYVELEAGGSLKDGARMWALAKVKNSDADIVTGDTVKAYLLAYTSFDGSLAHGIKHCATRVVCANTLAEARGENSVGWKLRHTSSIHSKLAQIQTTIQQTLKDHAESVEQFRTLARKQATLEKMKAYVKHVILDDVPEDKASTQLINKMITVQDLLENQRGLEKVPAARGTMWQAYNAVTEYVTHVAGRTEDSRLNGQWFGEGDRLNRRALHLALEA